MATLIPTITVLNNVLGNFTLRSTYSGEVNPNVTFNILFTVTDGIDPIFEALITIGINSYLTDINGQVSLDLIRGIYTADITKDGFNPENSVFEILDQNITEDIIMSSIGSFDNSYEDSYDI